MILRFLLFATVSMLVGAGWYQLDRFSTTPGDQSAAPALWPSDLSASLNPETAKAGLQRDSVTPILLVFLHPRCSCSGATLEQLEEILDSNRRSVRIAFVVYRSRVVNGDDDSPAIRSFAQNQSFHRDIRIVADIGGVLARRFGASTSGEIVLYSGEGRLLFQGGVTPLRGHLGNSDGADELRNALVTGAPQRRMANVFGCTIFGPTPAGLQGHGE